MRGIEREHTLERLPSLVHLTKHGVDRTGEEQADDVVGIETESLLHLCGRLFETPGVSVKRGLPEELHRRRRPAARLLLRGPQTREPHAERWSDSILRPTRNPQGKRHNRAG